MLGGPCFYLRLLLFFVKTQTHQHDFGRREASGLPFIKNNDDTYYIHGVPGHTHNASAMISVTAEYSRKRGIVRTIGTAWANEPVVMAAEDYTDSIEPRDKEERYNRAIERGIGRIIMIPENTNHMIEEPVRSISEIRTIVSPKDQLKTLTYINNVHGDGWVDPVTGTAGAAFNRRTGPDQLLQLRGGPASRTGRGGAGHDAAAGLRREPGR